MSRRQPPVDVAELDEYLDGLLSSPVTLEDMVEVRRHVEEMWPGCKVEAYFLEPTSARVLVWWDSFDDPTSPRVSRHVRAA